MKAIRITLALVVLVGLTVGATGFALAAPKEPVKEPVKKVKEKVTVCHKTNSAENPIVVLRVSPKAAEAHENHGDVVLGGPSIPKICALIAKPKF